MKNWMTNNWIISVTAGVLLGLSFPPFDLAFLSIPAFVLFFYLSDKCDNYKQLAYYSYAGFVVWNLIGTYWLMMASFGAGIAAILANSALMTIPLCLGKFFTNKSKSPLFIALLQASAWMAYEFLHHHWDLAWPWLTIANGWSNQIGVIQYISVTGFWGITFWVVLTSALTWQFIKTKERMVAYVSVAVFLFFPVWSFFLYGDEANETSDMTEVAVIQPNHDSYQNYGGMSGLEEVVDSLLILSEKTRTVDTELIVWPENAIDGAILMESNTVSRMADSASAWNTHFLAGTGLYELYDDENTPQLFRGMMQGSPYNYFNAAIFVSPEGETKRYNKANLVPIVERIPFVETLDAFDVFRWVNWGSLAGFGKGDIPTMLDAENFETPGLICYDSVYPTWIRKFVQDGATFITIITNDGWWGDTSGHHQHFAYARLRAIEFDRWVVRSANNGISGIISPNGTVQIKTDYWIKTGFTASIPNKYSDTIFTRFGNWLPILTLFLTGFSWLFFYGLGFRKKN
ncbi:MAG: apolipoprotein N-acyltransferase [Balneolaceae bacterium]